eukprot:m.191569 g.191569  ORF g.191569 m.191569 type:complete len:838 (+) comp17571_c0_seq2:322-2835(+)
MSLTADDFARMQDQLMQLKSQKYDADGKAKRLETELNSLKKHTVDVEKELDKANKVIAKSKKHKDIQGVIAEHEAEMEDIRRQNAGLTANLTELSRLNEKIQREYDEFKATGGVPGTPQQPRRSEANIANAEKQVASLTEELAATKLQLARETAALKASLAKETEERKAAQARIVQILDAKTSSPPAGAAEGGEAAAANSLQTAIAQLIADINALTTADDAQKTALVVSAEKLATIPPPASTERADVLTAANSELKLLLEKAEHHSTELTARLAESEARIAQLEDQLRQAQKKQTEVEQHAEAEISRWRDEFNKSEEKLKKKQSNFMLLQQEKDALLLQHQESSARLADSKKAEVEESSKQKAAERAKVEEAHRKALADVESSKAAEIGKLQQQLAEVPALREAVKQRDAEIQKDKAEIAQLRKQLDTAKADTQAKLDASKAQATEKIAQLEKIANAATTRANEGEEARAGLEKQLKERTDQLAELQKSRALDTKEIEDLRQLANKRKETIDQLARESQELTVKHTAQQEATKKDAEQKLAEERKRLTAQLTESQDKCKELQTKSDQQEEQLKEMVVLREELTTLQATAEELRTNLGQREETIQQLQSDLQKTQTQLEEQTRVAAEHLKTIQDAEAARVVNERKNANLIKDLKRQIKLEQKRGTMLEGELEDSRGRESSKEGDDKLSARGHRRNNSSSMSHSSLSHGGGGAKSESPDVISLAGVIDDPIISQNEHAELIHRVSMLQAEVAEWKERTHAMEAQRADSDTKLKQKSELVKHLLSGPNAAAASSPRRAVKVETSAATLQEQNFKLQSLLEETLMKNIQLQKMVDALSQKK